MKSPTLNITTIQANLVWENIDANLTAFTEYIQSIHAPTDIIVLPEMFTTGFSMNAAALAEGADGQTMDWFRKTASARQAIITGSIIFKDEQGGFRNRLIWMRPDGSYEYYDKHQLFKMSNEHEIYKAGVRKVIIEHNGWRVCPMICYDLRFPVWIRNAEDYDVIVLVANWPIDRRVHWQTLLRARAIENQAYVVGVNRIGQAKRLYYAGDTMVIDPFGEIIYHAEHQKAIQTHHLHMDRVTSVRQRIPYLQDRDQFELKV